MPVTGLTLQFFSAGDSSLFVSMAAARLLVNIARTLPGTAQTRANMSTPSPSDGTAARGLPTPMNCAWATDNDQAASSVTNVSDSSVSWAFDD